MAKDKAPDNTLANGPYSLGGFVGKGKAYKGEHRAPSTVAKVVKKIQGK